MFNVKRTVYGFEIYRAGVNQPNDRLATCDSVDKVERLVVWLSALDSLVGLDKVLEAKKAQQTPAVLPPIIAVSQ